VTDAKNTVEKLGMGFTFIIKKPKL